jgi:hypothetical protein
MWVVEVLRDVKVGSSRPREGLLRSLVRAIMRGSEDTSPRPLLMRLSLRRESGEDPRVRQYTLAISSRARSFARMCPPIEPVAPVST